MRSVRRLAVLGILLTAWAQPLAADPASLVPPDDAISAQDAQRALAREWGKIPARRTEALVIYGQIQKTTDSTALLKEHFQIALLAGRPELAPFADLEKRGALSSREILWYLDVLEQGGQTAEILRVAESRLSNSRPSRPLLELYLGTAERSGGQAQAERFLQTQAARFPHQTAFALAAADLALQRNDAAQAETLLHAARSFHPSNPEIASRLGDLALRRGQPGPALAEYEMAVAADPDHTGLRRQAARTAHYAGLPQRADALLQPLLQDTPRGSNGASISPAPLTAIRLENEAAHTLGNRHPIRAVTLYRQLASLEPDNLSARYGLAAAREAAGDLSSARRDYAALMENSPGSPVLQEITDRLQPRNALRSTYLFENEDSPGRLAEVSRNVFVSEFALPLGETGSAGIRAPAWIETPAGVPEPYYAMGVGGFLTWTPSPHWTLSGDYTFKGYLNAALESLHCWSAAVDWTPVDELAVRLAGSRESVLPNRFAFAQGIQTDRLDLSLTSPINRWLEVFAGASVDFFTDDNRQLNAETGARVLLLQRPGRLTAELRGRFITTENSSQMQFENGQVTAITHPYWTPQNYFRSGAGLTWTQSVFDGRVDYRTGARASLDTDGNPAVAFEAGLSGRLARRLVVEISGWIERSPEWNGVSATAGLRWSF